MKSFATVPELHDPVRGRVKGARAFEAFVSEASSWLRRHNATVAVIDDGRVCALEYNVVRWGKAELPPEAGVAVYVRGPNGKLAAARIYDDTDPPLSPPM